MNDSQSTDRWPIDRSWTVLSPPGTRETVKSPALLENKACVFLGAAGLGKTYELAHMAEVERRAGKNVQFLRLAALAQTAE